MKAMLATQTGPAKDVFQLTEVPTPTIKKGHVIVRVKATSVNPIDVKLRRVPLPFAAAFPTILHGDFAGIVTEVGEGAHKFKVGDEVYGCAGGVKGTEGGALAEFFLVDEQLTSLKPTNLSFAEAAALPLVAITSWEALIDKLKIHPGASVLIHAGLGGVGHIAAQLARSFGAIVHTTVSNKESIGISKSLGSHHPIDYTTEKVEDYVKTYTGGRGFDFVFDTVGGPNLQNSFIATKLNGAIACIATGGSHDLTTMYAKGISLHSVLMLIPLMTGNGRAHYGHILFEIKKLVESGAIKPLIDERVFNWRDVAAAHEYLESGQQKGKVVVQMD
jgi:NADPH2:quinone reductase